MYKPKQVDPALNDFLADLQRIKTLERANKLIEEWANIIHFFTAFTEVQAFLEYVKKPQLKQSERIKRSWGDVQTPTNFVRKIYHFLESEGFSPEIILEPTFGDGNFLLPICSFFPKALFVYGLEIQPHHRWNALLQLLKTFQNHPQVKTKFYLHLDNIFYHQFDEELFKASHRKLLIIGNPPWVTAAELSKLKAAIHIPKSNYKQTKGIAAITGKSNFDLTEVIIHRLLKQFSAFSGKIAILTKNSVIRNLLKFLPKASYDLSNIRALKIDTQGIFGKTANASLFVADLSPGQKELNCSFGKFSEENPSLFRKMGWVNNIFVSDIAKFEKVREFEGISSFEWRQGVKHDCSKILELTFNATLKCYSNKLNENIELENENIYPLLKGSDLKKFEIKTTNRFLLITQKNLQDETLQMRCPKTWQYLNLHESFFTKRKSKVYPKNNKFAIFGIGNYAFKKFKVAKAGLSKSFVFSLVWPINNKPVLFDDTCYFIGFDSYEEALLISSVLNAKKAQMFLEAIVDLEAKRPFTKELLMRINLKKLLEITPLIDLQKVWEQSGFHTERDLEMLKKARERLLSQ